MLYICLNEIKTAANVCIYGTNDNAVKIYELISKYRKDLNVMFFIDSNKTGEIHKIPIYKPNELYDRVNKIDAAIVASYSSRYYLELVLNSIGIKNVIKINKEAFDEIDLSNRKMPDISKVLSVFKYDEDRKLYEILLKKSSIYFLG